MEESEKRRERLKAMRMEAAQAGNNGGAESSVGPDFGHGLANPLIESRTAQPAMAEPYSRPRFDYYTDPMAAYASDKRSRLSPQVSHPHFEPPRPGHPNTPGYPAQGSYFLDQRPPQAHVVHRAFSPLASPAQNNFPGPPPEYTPNVWGSPGGPPITNFRPDSSRFGNFANQRYGQSGPGFGYGRANSPYQDSGRGRGRWQGNVGSQRAVQGGRRGSGHRESSSAETRPHRYYNKSMVEDPWLHLQPTVWKKIINPSRCMGTHDLHKSWLPNSIRMKKARFSEGQVKRNPQQSLAEYLAASLNEAVEEGVDDKSSE